MNVWTWGECRVNADELMHYGVSGQKHGLRRYQNEDGTLTPEGRARYKDMKNYGESPYKGLNRRQAEKMHGTTRAFAEWRVGRHQRKIDKVKEKYDKKINADKEGIKALRENNKKNPQDKKWNDMISGGLKEHSQRMAEKRDKKLAKYESKKAAQSAANANLKAYRDHSSTGKLLLRSASYEHARARGTGRLGSIMESIDPTGITRMHRDKKAYGRRLVWSDSYSEEYTANALDD